MDKIIILDYGSQFTSLIAKTIRKIGVYSEILGAHTSVDEILSHKPKGIILSGGPESVNNENAPSINSDILKSGIPILGICYGLQIICKALGGIVKESECKEFGHINIKIIKNSLIFKDISEVGSEIDVWMSHNDSVDIIPQGFETIASSKNTKYAVVENINSQIYGLQFHPEVTHTRDGMKIIDNFISHICKCRKDWSGSNYIAESVKRIREIVQNNSVFCALSGGIDSTTTALLIKEAIGNDRLNCVFVDTGLVRKNTVQELSSNIGKILRYKVVDAQDMFFAALKGVIDPEEKRKVIGKAFIDIFREEIRKTNLTQSSIAHSGSNLASSDLAHSNNSRNDNAVFLAQGTIYPDVIESMSVNSGKNVTIKSHHNVGGLPDDMGNTKIIEPIRLLFKDEVREIAKLLGVPNEIIESHPFPGPGFAIRIVGEVTKEKCDIIKAADDIFINALKNSGIYKKIWQAYAALLSCKSVGVMGDSRTYDHICVLKAVESVDGMTASTFEIEYQLLKEISKKIVNEVQGINRVYYDITSKPPATIEIE